MSCLSVLERAFPVHGSGGDSRRGGAAAAGRLHRHDRRSRLGLGLHPPHQRRHDAPARSRRAARGSGLLVHAAERSTRSWARRRARRRRSRANGWRAPANAGGHSSPSPRIRRCAARPARRCRRICARSRSRWSVSTRRRSSTTTSRTTTRSATARRRCTKSTASPSR